MTEKSLYERLGGEDRIRRIATSIFDNHAKNGIIKARCVALRRLVRWRTHYLLDFGGSSDRLRTTGFRHLVPGIAVGTLE